MSVTIECKTCLGEFKATPRLEQNHQGVEQFSGWNVGAEVWEVPPSQVDKTSVECHACRAARAGLSKTLDQIRERSRVDLNDALEAAQSEWEAGRVEVRARSDEHARRVAKHEAEAM